MNIARTIRNALLAMLYIFLLIGCKPAVVFFISEIHAESNSDIYAGDEVRLFVDASGPSEMTYEWIPGNGEIIEHNGSKIVYRVPMEPLTDTVNLVVTTSEETIERSIELTILPNVLVVDQLVVDQGVGPGVGDVHTVVPRLGHLGSSNDNIGADNPHTIARRTAHH